MIALLGFTFFYYSAHVASESAMYVLPYLVDPRGGQFAKLKLLEKQEYYNRVVSTLHSLIVTPVAAYCIWFSCGEESIFTDDACFIQPKKAQLYLILLGIGYCLYDLLVCIFKTKTSLSQRADIYIHHAMAITGASLSLYLGHQNIALGAACLFTEGSAIFMNIRWFMIKHQITNSLIYFPVSVGFMISFFLFRVFFLLFLQARNFQILNSNNSSESTEHGSFYNTLQNGNAILLLMMWILQVYWMKSVIGAVMVKGTQSAVHVHNNKNK